MRTVGYICRTRVFRAEDRIGAYRDDMEYLSSVHNVVPALSTTVQNTLGGAVDNAIGAIIGTDPRYNALKSPPCGVAQGQALLLRSTYST